VSFLIWLFCFMVMYAMFNLAYHGHLPGPFFWGVGCFVWVFVGACIGLTKLLRKVGSLDSAIRSQIGKGVTSGKEKDSQGIFGK